MKLNSTGYGTAMRRSCVSPTAAGAGEKSAFFRVRPHAQVSVWITGDAAGMVTGHRPWSPPIT